MKTIYIPAGRTASYETLTAEEIIVEGRLNVSGELHAKTITGNGLVNAENIAADDICVSDLSAVYVVCSRLIAKRVETVELYAAESAAVSCYLSASYVNTGRLAVALSEIDEVKTPEIIHLPKKRRSLLRFLLESALRSLLASLVSSVTRSDVEDAEYTVIQGTEDVTNPAA